MFFTDPFFSSAYLVAAMDLDCTTLDHDERTASFLVPCLDSRAENKPLSVYAQITMVVVAV